MDCHNLQITQQQLSSIIIFKIGSMRDTGDIEAIKDYVCKACGEKCSKDEF
jgi:hypothetical protein